MKADSVRDMLSPHFQRREFRCPCGCGLDRVDLELVSGLERLRALVNGRPLKILSGIRCADHNRAIGSVDTSQHVLGRAADVAAPAGVTPAELYTLARIVSQFASGGIGVYPDRGFVHLDIRTGPARWAQRTNADGTREYLPVSAFDLPR